MEFQISPLKGVGAIEFGMTPVDVRRNFEDEPKSFKRTPQDCFPCDYFESKGVFFYYDCMGHLEAIELASPSKPALGRLSFLGLGLDEATMALSGLDAEVQKQADGAIAYKLGVSIYAPLAKENPSAPVEIIIVFRSGYYK